MSDNEQVFVLNITVYEGRHFVIPSMDSVVLVAVGNQKKCTAVRYNSDSPYYNEYFDFELKSTINKLRDQIISFTVYQPKKFWLPRKCIGSFNIDMASVWTQPDHQFYHKWGVLNDPAKAPGPKGYLKLDICVLTKGVIPKYPTKISDKDDDIKGNLILPDGYLLERQWAQFHFNIYYAVDLSLMKRNTVPTSYIQITFAGLTGNTSRRKSQNPVWNERIALSELFPPLCQGIKVVLMYHGYNNAKASHFIKFKDISNSGEDGFLPTFGPTFIHLYNKEMTEYSGKILLSLETQILDKILGNPTPKHVSSIPPIYDGALPKSEIMYLFGAILSANCINKKYKDKCISFNVSMGNSENIIKYPMAIDASLDSMGKYCFLTFNEKSIVVSTQSTWPDNTRRFFQSNKIFRIYSPLKTQLDIIEKAIDSGYFMTNKLQFENLLTDAVKKLEVSCKEYLGENKSNVLKFTQNELDNRRTELRTKDITFIHKRAIAINLLKNKDKIYRKLKKLVVMLEHLIEDAQECFPDSFIWMYVGDKKTAYVKISSRHLIYSRIKNECGELCGVVHNVFFKPIHASRSQAKCGTKTAMECKAQIILWICKESERQMCMQTLPSCYKFPEFQENVPAHLICEQYFVFECRVYIYQGRFNPGADKSGLADPFLRIIFDKLVRQTSTKPTTIHPLWDETITFSQINVYGSLNLIVAHPPLIVIEALDQDKFNKTELLGRCSLTPRVPQTAKSKAKLHWINVYDGADRVTGNILIDAELIEVIPGKPADDTFLNVPYGVRPEIEKYRMEVIFWGVRSLKKISMLTINRPKITIECGEHTIESSVLSNARKNLNFSLPYTVIDIDLPIDKEYLSPLSIQMYDCRGFGRFVFSGTHLSDATQFMCKWMTKEERDTLMKTNQTRSETSSSSESNDTSSACDSVTLRLEEKLRGKSKPISHTLPPKHDTKKNKNVSDIIIDDENFDWWTKYYCSMQDSNDLSADSHTVSHKDKLKIYPNELENQPEFMGFNDQLKSFEIYHGKRTGDELIDEVNIVGIFKGAINIYKLPTSNGKAVELNHFGLPVTDGALSTFPSNEPVGFVTRVYIVKGMNLKPKDILNGKSDPYIRISMGHKVINDSKNYIMNQINPIFGRCFELIGAFPEDYKITISVWDYDLLDQDDLIGETQIDLENRLFTKHRANCGISNVYQENGPCSWRDQQKPSNIIDKLCRKYSLNGPLYEENSIQIQYTTFKNPLPVNPDKALQREILSLLALRRWHKIPVAGFHLVPEHVETRSLFHPHRAGIEQGKLQMWIDIFPYNDLPPPRPVDIAQRLPVQYELRVIVWNMENVLLLDDFFFTGEKKSDIYVKGWLTDPEEAQSTDVHYNSVSGEGNFNWRFLFPFEYLSIENKIHLSVKESAFDVHLTERKVPCILQLQVWDNDTFTADDFIGNVYLELSRLPRGAKMAKKCNSDILSDSAPKINLFKTRRHKGWWPMMGKVKDETTVTGKIEAEFHLLTAEEAKSYPAGLGRSEPQKLSDPKRPDIAFSWLQNPLKALKFVWEKMRWKICKCACWLLILIIVVVTIYTIPQHILKRLIGAK